jgi:signal transduction histidine kinase
VSVRGVVTFISGLEYGRFVVAPEDHPNLRGVEVVSKAQCEDLTCGAVVLVSGAAVERDGAVSIDADTVDILRVDRLASPPVAKQSDYRKGLLDGRVVALEGTVREVRPSPPGAGSATDVLLLMDGYTATVKLPWKIDKDDDIIGEPVQIIGLALGVVSDGKRVDSVLEVENADGIVFLRNRASLRVLEYSSIVLGGVLICVSVVLLVLWLRVLRERRETAVVAAERRRMAADLHDTIEQHLAGANLLAASVMQLDGTPENVRDAMKNLMSLLANAKMEVRSAVLNLRSVGGESRTLEEAIADMAAALGKTGVRTRYRLRGLPEQLSEGERQDILLILHEASTNAVKHGRAKTILFTCDPREDGGFVLRVLNDGAPFEIDRALGPETGHYGLSGMRERALRNRLSLSWGKRGKWSYVQLGSEG